MKKNERIKIGAVICAYNNKENLKKLVTLLLSQSYPLEEIIIIDNASSDGTSEMIRKEFPHVTLFSNSINLGVGGGYAQGMDYAYKKNYEWIWLLDGDSLPTNSSLEELVKAFVNFKTIYPKIGILASLPIDPFTKKMDVGALWRNRFIKIPIEFHSLKNPISIDTTISSGSLINKEVIKEIGLPRSDFFMDFIDHEYNFRIRKTGYQILRVFSSIIYHRLGRNKKIRFFCFKIIFPIHPPWRWYYMTRNELYTYLYEFPNFKTFFFYLYKKLKYILFIILFYPQKIERLKYIFLGIKDGLKGYLGKNNSIYR